MGRIDAVCISDKKGMVKKEVPAATLKENWGIVNDAHAGDWHRQVSLLASESISRVKEVLPSLKKGAFAENIITSGLNLSEFSIGDTIRIGSSVRLEVTQIGKECHNSGCAIKQATGDCIMPREGIFAKVVSGGIVAPGDDVFISPKP